MLLSDIRDELKAEILSGEDQLDKDVGVAGGADLLDDILSPRSKGSVLLTGLNSAEMILAAQKAGVEALVFVRGKSPEKHAINFAKKHGIPLLVTRFSLFVACGRLYMSGLRGLDGSW
jgi:predicted transcriptional regulator